MTKLADLTLREALKLIKQNGSGRQAAKALGVPRTTFQAKLVDLKKDKFLERKARNPVVVAKPRKGVVKRFIFSSAQDGTKVHEPFLLNLEAYAAHMEAEIKIAGFTYNKSLFEDTTRGKATFHPLLAAYMTTDQIDVGGKLLFCGDMNISPTATDPLSGFETYTRKKWGVFPHPRIQLQSVPTMFADATKIIMTTGAVTRPNYVQKKAGIKAEFHHIVGAVIVEIDSDGDVFARHLIAEADGSFNDLDSRVRLQNVVQDDVEAITWGDIHAEQLEQGIVDGCWGPYGMLDTLGPKFQFVHDVSDFTARNHHTIKNSHELFRLFIEGKDSVESGIATVRDFFEVIERSWCKTIVVQSNHDDILRRWLSEADYRRDPENAVFFLEQQLALYRAMSEGVEHYNPLRNALWGDTPPPVKFLHETESCKIVNDSIECGLHGHKGANGSKGHIKQFARMGSKANVGHSHSAGIYEGIYQAGTCSKLDLGYNRGGLSSWNHSHIVTYKNGKRTIVTMRGDKWRA